MEGNTQMRRSILAITLATVLSLALSGAASAGQASQTLDMNGGLSFSSILGGNSSGNAVLSGDITSGEIGTLRGTVNFAFRDESLTVSPTTTLTFITDQTPVPWQLLTCETYFCSWTYGTATFERSHAQGPVDVRLGQLKGNGTLNLTLAPSCVANCPPPGAYYNVPSAGGFLSGAVTGSKDAGTFQMYSSPVIH